jgi:hypothetical protein
MKNLSLPKLLGFFGGFLLLLLVITVVAARAHQRGVASGPRITKVYAPHELPPAPVAPAPPPTSSAVTQSTPTSGVSAARADTEAAAPTEIPPAPKPFAAQDPMMAHLAALDSALEETNSRLATLESTLVHPAPTPRPRAAARQVPSIAREATPVRSDPVLAVAAGYKTLAVVGHRAWFQGPDGGEDSASAGDPLPVPRVRLVRPETGVVITSGDQTVLPP